MADGSKATLVNMISLRTTSLLNFLSGNTVHLY